jgi:glyoxylate/hydroxypyruvate reductase A
MNKPVCVLWIDEAPLYVEALARAGLRDRMEVHSLGRKDKLPDDLAARAEVLVAWDEGSYLKNMPKLRWIGAMTAGVEHWLATAELRPDVTLTCARGSHRVPMPENILGAIFHITKPYMAIALEQRESRWTRRVSVSLVGKTLGILGLGSIGKELARKAAALDMSRRSMRRRRPTPCSASRISSCCSCRPRPRPRISSTPRGCAR